MLAGRIRRDWKIGRLEDWNNGMMTYQVSDGPWAEEPVRSYNLNMKCWLVVSENKTRLKRGRMEDWNDGRLE
jgi:hypothetical protein